MQRTQHDIPLRDLVPLQEAHPDLSLRQVMRFILLAARFKNDIILVQPADLEVDKAPDVLPCSIKIFLEHSCLMSIPCVDSCWNTLKSFIWENLPQETDQELFSQHGHHLGLSMSYSTQITSQGCGLLTISLSKY
jgi:hypothetical protein